MERLKQLRLERGLSQADLAAMAGVTRQAIAQYERGERTPAGDILVRLSHALGVSSAYLLGMTDNPERDDRLPEDWEAVVEEALREGFTPDDVRKALQMLRLALGKTPKDKGERQ